MAFRVVAGVEKVFCLSSNSTAPWPLPQETLPPRGGPPRSAATHASLSEERKLLRRTKRRGFSLRDPLLSPPTCPGCKQHPLLFYPRAGEYVSFRQRWRKFNSLELLTNYFDNKSKHNNINCQFELYLYLTEKKVRGIRGTSLLSLGSGRLITGEYRKTLMAI